MNIADAKNALATLRMVEHDPKELPTFIAQIEASLSKKDVEEVNDRIIIWKKERKSVATGDTMNNE